MQLATNANRFETSFTGRKRRQIEFLAPLDLDDDFDQDYLDLMESVTEMTDQEFRSLGFPGLATNKKSKDFSHFTFALSSRSKALHDASWVNITANMQ